MATDETTKYKNKSLRDWKPVFLAALAETGMVGKAARAAGIAEYTARRAKDTRNRKGADLLEAEVFGRAWRAALAEASEKVQLEIRRRAMEGIEHQRPIFYHGEQVGMEVFKVYSERLLIYLSEKLESKVRVEEEAREWGPVTVNPAEPSLIEATEAVAAKRWAELLPLLASAEKERGEIEADSQKLEADEGGSGGEGNAE